MGNTSRGGGVVPDIAAAFAAYLLPVGPTPMCQIARGSDGALQYSSRHNFDGVGRLVRERTRYPDLPTVDMSAVYDTLGNLEAVRTELVNPIAGDTAALIEISVQAVANPTAQWVVTTKGKTLKYDYKCEYADRTLRCRQAGEPRGALIYTGVNNVVAAFAVATDALGRAVMIEFEEVGEPVVRFAYHYEKDRLVLATRTYDDREPEPEEYRYDDAGALVEIRDELVNLQFESECPEPRIDGMTARSGPGQRRGLGHPSPCGRADIRLAWVERR